MDGFNRSHNNKSSHTPLNCFQRKFLYCFPALKVKTHTPQGKSLRYTTLFWLSLDILCMFFCLYFVGFQPMLAALWISVWGYSMYLTLREWVGILYCVFKMLNAIQLVLMRDGTPMKFPEFEEGYMRDAQYWGVFAVMAY